ncbi:MAG: hypothetical protein KJ906_03715 [Nanoarchaeota archaeon]|nr:hypothetical protein [Nanoarchaeota archaeon]
MKGKSRKVKKIKKVIKEKGKTNHAVVILVIVIVLGIAALFIMDRQTSDLDIVVEVPEEETTVEPVVEPVQSVLILDCSNTIGERSSNYVDKITIMNTPVTISTISLFGMGATEPVSETIEFSKLSSNGDVVWTEKVSSDCISSDWCDFVFDRQTFDIGQVLQMDNLRDDGSLKYHGSCGSSNLKIVSYFIGNEYTWNVPTLRIYS